MGEADLYRELAQAHDDVVLYRNLLALLPYTVHVDHEVEWVQLVRRDAQQRAAALARIPTPRAPGDAPVRRGIRLPQRGHL